MKWFRSKCKTNGCPCEVEILELCFDCYAMEDSL